MGDRCYMTMMIHPDDLAKACDRLDELSCFELDRIEYEFDEVNYGASEERQRLAESGVRFYGAHSAGGDYPGFDFYSDGSNVFEWPTDDHGGYAINIITHKVGSNLPPKLNTDEIANCEKFCAAWWAMRNLIDEAAKSWSPPPDPWDELDTPALDAMVHQAWGQGASEINNQGRAKQIAWLKSRGIAP